MAVPKVHEKRYLVAIPIPYLDKRGRRLRRLHIEQWTQMTLQELTECFGGATAIASPGTNIVGDQVLFEKGQMLVMAGCESRNDFLAERERIAGFV